MTDADLRLVFENSGLAKMLAEQKALNAQMSAMIANANRAAGGIDNLGGRSTDAAAKVGGLNRAIGGIKDVAGQLGLVAGAAGVVALGKDALSSAMNYETLGVQMEVFTGSVENATKTLKELDKFSVVTPFTPNEVNASGRALLGLGIAQEKLIPSLKLVGDLASGLKIPFEELSVAYGKTMAGGIVMTEDLNKFQDRGINIMGELAKMYGTNILGVKKMAEQSKITSEAFNKALSSMTAEGGLFHGMMDKMSLSSEGLISTMEGDFQNIMRDIGTAILPTVIGAMQGFMDLLKGSIAFVSDNADAFKALGIAVATVGGAFAAVKLATIGYSAALTAGAAIQAWYTGLTWSLQVAQLALATGTNVATGALEAFRIVMASNPWTIALVAIGAIAGAVYLLTGNTKELTKQEQLQLDLSNKIAKAYGTEAADAKILFDKLKTLDKKSDEYKATLAKINEQYGTYLPNLLTNKSSLEDVAKAQTLVNEALMTKIRLQAKEQTLQEITNKHLEESMQGQFAIAKATGLTISQIERANQELGKFTKGLDEATMREQIGTAAIMGSANDMALSFAKSNQLSEETRAVLLKVGQSGSIASTAMFALAGATGVYGQRVDELNEFFDGDKSPIDKFIDGAKSGGGLKGANKEAKAAAGSIAYLNEQISALNKAYENTTSQTARDAMILQLAELDRQLKAMKSEKSPSQGGISGMLQGIGAAARATAQDLTDLNFVLSEGGNSESGDPWVGQIDRRAAAIERFHKRMQELGDALKGQIKSSFIDFGASAAEAIGHAIGAGTSLADAFKKSIGQLLIQMPKLIGMTLIQAAATPDYMPLAVRLGLLGGGLALVGLSGIAAGYAEQKSAAQQANLNGISGGVGGQQSAPVEGLATAGASIPNTQFIFNLDGQQFAQVIYPYQQKEIIKRGR